MSGRSSGPGRWTVRPAQRLRGELVLPGDKSISHRALLFSALSSGEQLLGGLSRGEDVLATLAALRAWGADIEERPDGLVRVGELPGGRLREASSIIDCGNSGTSMRLLAGVAAGQPFETTLTGDESLRRRPMARVSVPLRAMGATVDGREEGRLAPLQIRGGTLRGISHRSEIASAQVKSCLLLAGLFAEGRVEVREPSRSRDHTERMFQAAGITLDVSDEGVAMEGGQQLSLPSERIDVPTDLSAAAFFVVASAILDDSALELPRLGFNPTRTGFLDVVGGTERSDLRTQLGEPRGILHVRGESDLRRQPLKLSGSLIPRLIDEIPVLCVLAARCEGVTVICDAEDLRAKESDRIATTAAMLRAFGVSVEERPDGMRIEGRADRPLRGGCSIDSHGDHRIAMAAAVGALAADAPVEVTGTAAVETSFPGFLETLESCVER